MVFCYCVTNRFEFICPSLADEGTGAGGVQRSRRPVTWCHSLNSEPDSLTPELFLLPQVACLSKRIILCGTKSFLKYLRCFGSPCPKIVRELVIEFPRSSHWHILILSYQFCLLNMLMLLNTQNQIRYLERLCNKNKCLQRRCFCGKTL